MTPLFSSVVRFFVVWMVLAVSLHAQTSSPAAVDATTLRGKVLCGYQGWFRCPGDAANQGWVHWSRNGKLLAPETLTFEMWPDMSEYSPAERYPATGFTHADGRPAELFSSDNPATVLRHFTWMRDYGIDGVWLQHFAVDLPGGPAEKRYPSRIRVLEQVRAAAHQTGRTWALAYDISGLATDKIYDVVTRDWQKIVDSGVTKDDRYLHEGGQPAVELWGFYFKNKGNAMTAELANRLIDFFKKPGPYAAYLVGGGDWDWRRNTDPEWAAFYHRFDAYSPWNVGNTSKDKEGVVHAATGLWEKDQAECEKTGVHWIPVVYPGFSWDNLQKKEAGASLIPRRGGKFLWEQFVALAKLKPYSTCVAMFDEVDEGTAIFKVTSDPPTQAHFVGLEGLPSDWYLRLVGEGTKMLRGEHPPSAEIPFHP